MDEGSDDDSHSIISCIHPRHMTALEASGYRAWFVFSTQRHGKTISDLKRCISSYFLLQNDETKLSVSLDGFALLDDQSVRSLLKENDVIHVQRAGVTKRWKKEHTGDEANGGARKKRKGEHMDGKSHHDDNGDKMLVDELEKRETHGDAEVQGERREVSIVESAPKRKRKKKKRTRSAEWREENKTLETEQRNAGDELFETDLRAPGDRNLQLNELILEAFSATSHSHNVDKEKTLPISPPEMRETPVSQSDKTQTNVVQQQVQPTPSTESTPTSHSKTKRYAHYLPYMEGTSPQVGDVIAFKRLDESSGMVSKYREAKILCYDKSSEGKRVMLHLLHPEDSFFETQWDQLLNVKYMRWDVNMTDEEKAQLNDNAQLPLSQQRQARSSKDLPMETTKEDDPAMVAASGLSTPSRNTPAPVSSNISSPLPDAFGSRQTPSPNRRVTSTTINSSPVMNLSSPLTNALPALQLFEGMHVNYVGDGLPLQQTGIVRTVHDQEGIAVVSGERIPFSSVTTPVPPQCSVGETIKICRGKHAGETGTIEGFQPLQNVWLVTLDSNSRQFGFKREYLARYASKRTQS